jgi:hypothetical protein
MQSGATRKRLARLGVSCGVCLGASRAAGEAPSEPACVVQMMPAQTAGEWQRAAMELRQRVRQWPAPDRDCRELLVEITQGGALLTITTRDGRRARRSVATPSALVPAASALAVSVETAAPARPSPVGSAGGEGATEPETADLSGQLFLGGGLRLGTPGVYASPVLRGAASLTLGAWEFGTYFDGAPHHWLTASDVPTGFTMWSLSSGATVGRRQPLGGLDLLAGLMFGASFVRQESRTEELDDGAIEIDVEQGDGVDVELAGYFGVATPRARKVRFRAQIEIGFPLSHPGQTRELDSDLPPLPGWSATGVLGVEFGAP